MLDPKQFSFFPFAFSHGMIMYDAESHVVNETVC